MGSPGSSFFIDTTFFKCVSIPVGRALHFFRLREVISFLYASTPQVQVVESLDGQGLKDALKQLLDLVGSLVNKVDKIPSDLAEKLGAIDRIPTDLDARLGSLDKIPSDLSDQLNALRKGVDAAKEDADKAKADAAKATVSYIF